MVSQSKESAESGPEQPLVQKIKRYLFQRSPQLHDLVRIAQQGDKILLSGKVTSFYQRQVCINTCQRVAGVLKIDDRLEVKMRPTA